MRPPFRRAAAPSLAALLGLAACATPQPCPSPLVECGGECVDVQSDRRNCGACDHSCAAGLACVAAACRDENPACPVRTGGAFVTLGTPDGAAVKLWVERADFVAEAQQHLAAGGATAPRIPALAVVEGSDCDAQWTWHVNEATAQFADTKPSTTCDVLPSAIEANVASYVLAVGWWCPAAAKVLAVQVRPQ